MPSYGHSAVSLWSKSTVEKIAKEVVMTLFFILDSDQSVVPNFCTNAEILFSSWE